MNKSQNINFRGKYFPCKECSENFKKNVQKVPFVYNNREEGMKYVCNLHNVVNKETGKPEFPCEKVQEVWGQKSCGCNA